MSLDLENSYKSIKDKIKSYKTSREVLDDEKKIRQQIKDNEEKIKDSVTSTIDKLKDQKKRYQKEVKNQIDNLLDIIQTSAGSGPASIRYIKRKFIQTAIKIEPLISEILTEETISALGCSQQQTYPPQIIYIKVSSVDLKKLLKHNPDETVFSACYEKVAPYPNQLPYSMNRELWDRIQILNQPNDFYGFSGQKLFTITYTQTDGVITGDFFKVELVNRVTGPNKIADFIVDYYKAIQVVDTSNIFAQLMEILSGVISFEASLGFGEIDMSNKFLLLLQRILGLCFDSKREIDVGGNAKVGELDSIDDSFFEFTDIDLRNLDTLISNIQNGVVEFEECGNVKLPVDYKQILDNLLLFNQSDTVEEQEEAADNLTDSLSENELWNLLIPNSVDLKLTIDISFLKNLPRAIMFALLSPKIILPLLVMAKAFGQLVGVEIETFMDFIKAFKTYVINIMSKIGSIFVKELFELIKLDIRNLMNSLIQDLSKEKMLKKYAMILTLVELVMILVKLVDDWRKCKSVVDELLALLELADAATGFTNKIPAPLLAASELLQGYSATKAFINVVEEFQKKGLPTGPMPDGSPNLMLQSVLSTLKGQDNEMAKNAKVQVFVKPLAITPAGMTMPAGNIFGKPL